MFEMTLYVRYAVLSERKQISLKSAVADTYFIKISPDKKKPQISNKLNSLTCNTRLATD